MILPSETPFEHGQDTPDVAYTMVLPTGKLAAYVAAEMPPEKLGLLRKRMGSLLPSFQRPRNSALNRPPLRPSFVKRRASLTTTAISSLISAINSYPKAR